MAKQNVTRRDSHIAGADLSAKQYHFMRFSSENTVDQASGSAGEDNHGVLMNKPAVAGRAAAVALEGKVKITAGGSLIANDLITTNGSGRATAAGSGDWVFGRVLTAAGADGEVVTMELMDGFFNNDLA